MDLLSAFDSLKRREVSSFDPLHGIQFNARRDLLVDATLTLVCGPYILHAGTGLVGDTCFSFPNANESIAPDAMVTVVLRLPPIILSRLARLTREMDPIAVFSSRSPYGLVSFARDAIRDNFATAAYLDELGKKVGRNHWWLDACFVADGILYAQGWAIPPAGWSGGVPAVTVDGLPALVEPAISRSVSELYWFLAGDAVLGFCATAPIKRENDFSRVSLSFGALDEAQGVRRFDLYQINSWPDRFRFPIPPDENIHRVSGPTSNRFSFINGGKTDYERFRILIGEALGVKSLEGLSVLDWGVGCGRISRYFIEDGACVTGADIDEGNITWCRNNMNPGRFEAVRFMPPTQLEADSFDAIISSSVLSHLTEEAMHAWLKEINRLLKPNGVALLSFNGSGNAYLYGSLHPPAIEALDGYGFFDEWRTHDLDDAVPGAEDYYRFTIMSDRRAKEIFAANGKLERIVTGVTSMHQDIAVLRKI